MMKVLDWTRNVVFLFGLWTCIECLSEVQYEGPRFVAEGHPFHIVCHKSSYTLPKWTRNGMPVDQSEFAVTERTVDQNTVMMELGVVEASWSHRGHYKCDTLSGSSHVIEVVPSNETEQVMLSQERVKLRPNRTLKLVCNEDENRIFPVNWYKDGQRVVQSDPRVRMDGRHLWIVKSIEGDTGEYTCVIEVSGLSYPFAEHLGTRIQVTYGPRVELFPTQIRPILTRNLSLECLVRGFPSPRVAWFVDNEPLNSFQQSSANHARYGVSDNPAGYPDSIFTLTDVQEDDNHIITCVAESVEGVTSTTTVLAVRVNKINTNEPYPGKGVILIPGQDLFLQCNNSDNYNAAVYWLKNGSQLNTTDKRVKMDASLHSLSIENALESDCGDYTCTSGGESAIISVRSPVRLAPLDSSRNVVQNQNIVLICNVTQGMPAPVLQWFKDDEPLNLTDPRVHLKAATEDRGIVGTELVISDASFEDRATYKCIATNDISSANATILVRVKDKYAALWPFLGICAEVAILCTIIFIYEKRRQKPDFDETETDHNTENKSVPDQGDKGSDVRQRK